MAQIKVEGENADSVPMSDRSPKKLTGGGKTEDINLAMFKQAGHLPLRKIIQVNENKKIQFDDVKFTMDGCFEAQIVQSLNLNRGGLEPIKKRKKPKYVTTRKRKEEVADFKEYFKLKKDLQEGDLEKKALATYEDIKAFKRGQDRRREIEFLEEGSSDSKEMDQLSSSPLSNESPAGSKPHIRIGSGLLSGLTALEQKQLKF